MKKARDYIIFPLDVPDAKEARRFVSLLSGHVGMFKVGLELFIRSGPELIRFIKSETGAGVFLDLKLHDIPVTVERAMAGIADLDVDLATVHCGESSAMLEAAVSGAKGRVGVLGVTVLTSTSREDIRDAGFKERYASDLTRLVMERGAMAKSAGLSGLVCSGLEVGKLKGRFADALIYVTPGIRPAQTQVRNDDQHRIVTPADAIQRGADYLVIGRPIRDAEDPVTAARGIIREIETLTP